MDEIEQDRLHGVSMSFYKKKISIGARMSTGFFFLLLLMKLISVAILATLWLKGTLQWEFTRSRSRCG